MKNLKLLLNGDDIIAVSGNLDTVVTGVTNDSRKVEKGFCFIAIKGFRQDGLKFIEDAVKKGAQSIVTESAPLEKYNHICWIQVKNDRFAFSKVAARFYDNIPDRFYTIGVTGTNGKTTITSLVAAILEQQAKTALIGTLGMSCGDITRNTSLTTPEPTDIFEFLTLVNQQGGENLVMEVSSVALRLHRVEDITFSQAIFTTFSGDHLDFHKTMDDYLESKILLFNRLKTDDWAVINIDDPNAYKIIEHLNCKYLTYGFSEEADVKPLKYKCTTSGIKATIHTPMGDLDIKASLIGRVNLLNILAAVTSALIKNVSFKDITAAIAGHKPVKGRLDFAYKKDFSVLIDYAHTDKALETLLQSMREIVRAKLIVVFGAGGGRDKSKRPRMGDVASKNADVVIITSDNPRYEDPAAIIGDVVAGIVPGFKDYIVETDRKKAIERALDMAQKGDLVAVAGKGHEDYQIFKDKTIHFDDYEVVREIMAAKEKQEKNA